ncbi:RNA polymerase sigma factor [Chthonomonas calidirosea]|uniref:RNA polymerase sigma factor n=1 Tax=Chthonomonas calidirosea TaxID=454171 RepID=UPI0006EC560C|nr:sigma-70 family RNA polymerase sigma factor [Chthonomonas calidirosea]CEK15052.1 RNA polymerase sigma factor, sigma-70 family [Chthonomonas calidirosea]
MLSRSEQREQIEILRSQTGAERLDYLCRTYRDNILRICYAVLHEPNEAEDATQEVLLLASKHFLQYRGECALTTWIWHIAYNYSLKCCRQREAHAYLPLPEEALTPDRNEHTLENILFFRQMESTVLARLNPCNQLIYIYTFHYEMSSEEIAQALPLAESLSASAVRSRLYRIIRPTIEQVQREFE